MLHHILLAIDGSSGSRKAADHAKMLLTAPDAQLTIVVAIEPPTAFAVPPFDGFVTSTLHPAPEELVAAQALIEAMKEEIGRDRVHTRVEVGPAAETICRVADEVGADLIVLGARGMNPAARWLLGSVSDRVVHHASQPVTVVR